MKTRFAGKKLTQRETVSSLSASWNLNVRKLLRESQSAFSSVKKNPSLALHRELCGKSNNRSSIICCCSWNVESVFLLFCPVRDALRYVNSEHLVYDSPVAVDHFDGALPSTKNHNKPSSKVSVRFSAQMTSSYHLIASASRPFC